MLRKGKVELKINRNIRNTPDLKLRDFGGFNIEFKKEELDKIRDVLTNTLLYGELIDNESHKLGFREGVVNHKGVDSGKLDEVLGELGNEYNDKCLSRNYIARKINRCGKKSKKIKKLKDFKGYVEQQGNKWDEIIDLMSGIIEEHIKDQGFNVVDNQNHNYQRPSVTKYDIKRIAENSLKGIQTELLSAYKREENISSIKFFRKFLRSKLIGRIVSFVLYTGVGLGVSVITSGLGAGVWAAAVSGGLTGGSVATIMERLKRRKEKKEKNSYDDVVRDIKETVRTQKNFGKFLDKHGIDVNKELNEHINAESEVSFEVNAFREIVDDVLTSEGKNALDLEPRRIYWVLADILKGDDIAGKNLGGIEIKKDIRKINAARSKILKTIYNSSNNLAKRIKRHSIGTSTVKIADIHKQIFQSQLNKIFAMKETLSVIDNGKKIDLNIDRQDNRRDERKKSYARVFATGAATTIALSAPGVSEFYSLYLGFLGGKSSYNYAKNTEWLKYQEKLENNIIGVLEQVRSNIHHLRDIMHKNNIEDIKKHRREITKLVNILSAGLGISFEVNNIDNNGESNSVTKHLIDNKFLRNRIMSVIGDARFVLGSADKLIKINELRNNALKFEYSTRSLSKISKGVEREMGNISKKMKIKGKYMRRIGFFATGTVLSMATSLFTRGFIQGTREGLNSVDNGVDDGASVDSGLFGEILSGAREQYEKQVPESVRAGVEWVSDSMKYLEESGINMGRKFSNIDFVKGSYESITNTVRSWIGFLGKEEKKVLDGNKKSGQEPEPQGDGKSKEESISDKGTTGSEGDADGSGGSGEEDETNPAGDGTSADSSKGSGDSNIPEKALVNKTGESITSVLADQLQERDSGMTRSQAVWKAFELAVGGGDIKVTDSEGNKLNWEGIKDKISSSEYDGNAYEKLLAEGCKIEETGVYLPGDDKTAYVLNEEGDGYKEIHAGESTLHDSGDVEDDKEYKITREEEEKSSSQTDTPDTVLTGSEEGADGSGGSDEVDETNPASDGTSADSSKGSGTQSGKEGEVSTDNPSGISSNKDDVGDAEQGVDKDRDKSSSIEEKEGDTSAVDSTKLIQEINDRLNDKNINPELVKHYIDSTRTLSKDDTYNLNEIIQTINEFNNKLHESIDSKLLSKNVNEIYPHKVVLGDKTQFTLLRFYKPDSASSGSYQYFDLTEQKWKNVEEEELDNMINPQEIDATVGDDEDSSGTGGVEHVDKKYKSSSDTDDTSADNVKDTPSFEDIKRADRLFSSIRGTYAVSVYDNPDKTVSWEDFLKDVESRLGDLDEKEEDRLKSVWRTAQMFKWDIDRHSWQNSLKHFVYDKVIGDDGESESSYDEEYKKK